MVSLEPMLPCRYSRDHVSCSEAFTQSGLVQVLESSRSDGEPSWVPSADLVGTRTSAELWRMYNIRPGGDSRVEFVSYEPLHLERRRRTQ